VLHPYKSLLQSSIYYIFLNHGKNLAPLQGVDNLLHKSLLMYQRVLGIEHGTHP
jgi:hypothetical protein